MKFSPSTFGFYHPEIHGDRTPSDAIKVADELYESLMIGQSSGRQIVIGPDGAPELAEVAVTPLADLQALAQQRIDAHFETLYARSVANSAIGAEYDAAYIVAKEWLKDTTKPVPERIKALAETYGVTNAVAAQVVITKWTEAQAVAFDLRGAARLRAKLAIRQAVDPEGVAAAETAGRAAMGTVTFSI